MMQRILAGFSALPGADQAYVISRRQGLIASVGKKGKMPEIESTTKLVEALDRLEKNKTIGKGLELWLEGDKTSLISRLSEDSALVISGKKGGKIARWRHAVECDVEMLNSAMR